MSPPTRRALMVAAAFSNPVEKEEPPPAIVRVVVYIDDVVQHDFRKVIPRDKAERVAYAAYVQVEDPDLDDD